jgi:hypothetical protein
MLFTGNAITFLCTTGVQTPHKKRDSAADRLFYGLTFCCFLLSLYVIWVTGPQ